MEDPVGPVVSFALDFRDGNDGLQVLLTADGNASVREQPGGGA